MKQKLLFLLTALLLLTTGNAWGEIAYNQTLVDQDFSDVTGEATKWTTGGSGPAMGQTLRSGSNYYWTINFNSGGNSAATAYYTLPDFSSCDAFKISFSWGMYSCSAGNRNNLFKIVGATSDFATTGYVSGGSSSVTLNAGETATTLAINPHNSGTRGNANRTTTLYKITIEGISATADAVNNGVYLTITTEDESSTKLARTRISDYQKITRLHFESGQYYGQNAIDDLLVEAYIAADVVSDPTVVLTGVSGVERTVTITPGSSLLGRDVTTYYTTNGDEPTTSSNVYSSPLTISSSCTVKAVTISDESVSSNVVSLAVSAGTEVQLAAPKVALISVETNGSYYTPRYSISYDNSEVLLNPTSTLAATFNGSPVDISGGTFEPSAQGTFVVTATCEGYKSNSTEVTMEPLYEIKHESPNFNEIALANIQTTLGAGTWNASAGATRWANWSKTGGVNADLTPNYGDAYHYATVDADFTYDSWLSVTIGNAFLYLAGFGFGSNDNSKPVSCNIVDAVPNSIVVYTYCRNDWAPVDYKDGTSSYTIPTSMALKKVVYYAPVPATVSKTITAAGWATYCSPYALDLEHATGLADAYIVTGGNAGVLAMTSVKGGTVPANTGLLLKGDEGTATIPVVESSSVDVDANKLEGVITATEIVAETGYVLMASPKLGFYKNANVFTVGANTAYLPVDFDDNNPGARSAFFGFEEDPTGISAIEATEAETEGLKDGKYLIGNKIVLVKNGVKFGANGQKLN